MKDINETNSNEFQRIPTNSNEFQRITKMKQ